MTQTTISNTKNQRRDRIGVALLSLAAGATFGIAGTMLATVDEDAPVRPAAAQHLAVVRSPTLGEQGVSSCELLPADAAERCVADHAASACRPLTADAAERCLTHGDGSG